MEEKEKRVRAITRLYYSNPKVQEALMNFASNREIIPRYFEGFGKRPDILQYPSDIIAAVNKGATSFHASEELWHDPLQLNSDMTLEQMHSLRKGWDLLLDIDSPFLDCSKIAAKLIISALDHHGVKNYKIKFSGSKGFHIIVSWRAFPQEYNGFETRLMFPSWPRAISEYLSSVIRSDYDREVGKISSVSEIMKRTDLSEDELQKVRCTQCGKVAIKGILIQLSCPVCKLHMQKRGVKITKRRLKCLNEKCAGVLEAGENKNYYYCEYCKDPEYEKMQLSSDKHPELFEHVQGVSAEEIAKLDLVLVAPRHLFRMPYSLHEKTALASIVLGKEELDLFSPRNADPLRVNIKEFLPKNEIDEAKRLLTSALEWKRSMNLKEEIIEKRNYESYEEMDLSGVSEDLFPEPIKKLLKGLKDGRKRGLFILLTFLRSLKFSQEYVNKRIREWNNLNIPPLKEGYIKSQIEWLFKQKKQILPPNYEHASFYRDLGLLNERQTVKNPLVEVKSALRRLKEKKK